jgi:hypothetical protein
LTRLWLKQYLQSWKHTHKVSNAERKTEHDYSVEHTDINSKLESVGCNDAKEITGESFMFYSSALLL